MVSRPHQSPAHSAGARQGRNGTPGSLALGMWLIVAIVSGLALAATETRAATVLITGSNRGIGFEFARQYAEKGWRVIATCRHPEKAKRLQAIAARNPNVIIERLDVTDHDAIDALAAKYKDQPIDVLLNNAGISGGVEAQRFGAIDYSAFEKVYDVNVAGPMKMAEAFFDHVAASDHKKIITVSSSQGSIAETFGLLYAYRSSKTAVNMFMRTLAQKAASQGVIVGLIAPGPTNTDFMKGVPIPLGKPEDRVQGLIQVIDQLTLETTGSFLQYDGQTVPW